LKLSSSALLEHIEYVRSAPTIFEVFSTKKILPMLLLALMAVTAGTLIVAHAAPSITKAAKTTNQTDNDDVQATDVDDGQAGDTDDGNVQAGDQGDHNDTQTGTHSSTETQDGPDDNVTTGDQVEETGDTGTTGNSDVATMVERAILA
jgi:hypothetical protein